MHTANDIILAVDYHLEHLEVRWLDCASGQEQCRNIPTQRRSIECLVAAARTMASNRRGKVIWIMESTTGWARVKELLGNKVEFVLANVLQMPLPPKAYRHKSDKIDTGRIQREFLNGSLPQSYQPTIWWRQIRRLVDSRQDLIERQTAVKNWIRHFLQHETWAIRDNLWTNRGLRRLKRMELTENDRWVLNLKIRHLQEIAAQLSAVEERMQEFYNQWPEAQRVDAVRGIGMVTSVSILAHIGPIERFRDAEALISYAGLAPAHRQSDGTHHNGRIGGGGTDSHLRYLLVETMLWVCQIPRYRPAFERAQAKHGTNVARIIIARQLLRSIYKMLRDQVPFNQMLAA
ncbi:MAG TPA: IS110 family transposase [Tepidisphaeraceae bacterium]|nr:IS110 family transposase [Tepidisphaeraceae bacterium]